MSILTVLIHEAIVYFDINIIPNCINKFFCASDCFAYGVKARILPPKHYFI